MRNYLNMICLYFILVWHKYTLFRVRFRLKLDEVEKKYNEAIASVFNNICLVLDTHGVVDANELTRRDKIIGGFKFILLSVLADVCLATIFDSLNQVMVCTFNFYLLVPSLFYSVVGLAGIISMFIPKRRFLINIEANVKTVSRVILTSIYLSIIAINALIIQIFYTLGAIVKDPCIHNLLYVASNNFLPCVVTVCVVCLVKYSACILGAVQRVKISSAFN